MKLGGLLSGLIENNLPTILGGGAGGGGLGGQIISQLFNNKGKIDDKFLGSVFGSMFGQPGGAPGLAAGGGLFSDQIKAIPALPVSPWDGPGLGGIKPGSKGISDIQPMRGATAMQGFLAPKTYKPISEGIGKQASQWAQPKRKRPEWASNENIGEGLKIFGKALHESEREQAARDYFNREELAKAKAHRENVVNRDPASWYA